MSTHFYFLYVKLCRTVVVILTKKALQGNGDTALYTVGAECELLYKVD